MARVLVLGGTGWLSGEVARAALARGSEVTCLARGLTGSVPVGATLVAGDRSQLGAYTSLPDREWDVVVDVSWQPGMVASALAALAGRTGHWTYVSSCSVYARDDIEGQDETAPRHAPLLADQAAPDDYGPAKVRCEDLVSEAMGDRGLVARAGLIAGPGDPSDRFGYWVARFARAADGPVLVPEAPGLLTQTVDVRDLAAWIANASTFGLGGAVNAVGERLPLAEVLSRAARVAGFRGSMVGATPRWLAEHGVQPWSGPRSLPLWLPLPDYAGFGSRDDSRAVAAGLARRALDDTLADTLADERSRGLDRARRAGLARSEEIDLLALVDGPDDHPDIEPPGRPSK